MSSSDVRAASAAVPTALTDHYDSEFEILDPLQATSRYSKEAAKRLRDDGSRQYFEPGLVDKYEHLQDDPWVDASAVKSVTELFPDHRCRFLVVGAGYAGIMYAVHLVKAGFNPRDIRVIDSAGGFGGTWYWNRFPGLSCDVESYLYLPFLEETGYVPRHRYAYGDEIRSYADLVAEKWCITGVFQTHCQKMEWNEAGKEWKVELLQKRNGEDPQRLDVRTQFVVLANGLLNWPKLPDTPGILDYKGDVFHSSRWNYDVTGGSPTESELTKLKDKRVAIIGTGATAVQIVPELARWAKHAYVVQRTPSSVDERVQRQTDPSWFRTEVANGPGWQRERIRNFHAQFTTKQPPATDLVNDGWTKARTMTAVSGNPDAPKTLEQVPAYVGELHALDLPRQNRIRQRVRDTVKDPEIAEKLVPWYPTWCKRPCFHDEYLAAFNNENLTLLDTDGKGIDRITEDAVVVNGQSYPVDIIIFATGFRAPFIGSPADKGNMTVIGRGGVSMSDSWANDGPSTLHGILDLNFPNLLLSGPWQGALSGNVTFGNSELAKHGAYVAAKADEKAKGKPFAISVTQAGVEEWAMQILHRAAASAPLAGCTPGYFNAEGDLDRVPPEGQMKLARSGVWGGGIEDFLKYIENWRKAGDMNGITVEI